MSMNPHGGDPGQAFARLGIPPRPVTDFSVNVNPLGPPRAVSEAWPDLIREICRYPTLEGDGVRAFYRERFGLPGEYVLPGNGSIELIYLVPRVLKIKRAAVMQPCFLEYERALRLSGVEVFSVPLSAPGLFRPLAVEEWEGHLAGTDAVYIGNPNNPTSTITPRKDLLELARRHPDVLFLVDEAFVQFLDHPGNVSMVNRRYLRPNLLVFHSLTKFYCLPGLRLGALVGSPETLAKILPFKEPWTVNAPAEGVARLLAASKKYERYSRELIAYQRQKIAAAMDRIPGIRLFPSEANFFLAQWTATRDLDDLLRPLLLEGFHVRDCRNFPGLKDNFFRFAVRTTAENKRFQRALIRIAGDALG